MPAKHQLSFIVAVATVALGACGQPDEPPPSASAGKAPATVNLSPATWPDGEYESYLDSQARSRTTAGFATGRNGAVTVAKNGLAARAGLEAIRQGGNAIDAALTTAMAQVALSAGAPVSYFGIMSLVYYDAETGRVHTMNAEWNTIRGETDPLSIPGGFTLTSEEGRRGLGDPSGRTAMVGGFMKGVGAAHDRFGQLPFAQLFEPSIYIAERGIPVTASLAEHIRFRADDLSRLPSTRAVFTKDDGSFVEEGDELRQPQLAETLRKVAAQGADYLYHGPWAEKLVAAVQADGGKMTLEDLAAYEVDWTEPLIAKIGGGYTLHTNPWPNAGGVAMVEAQNLATASGLVADGHWTKSSAALEKALDIAQQGMISYLPHAVTEQLYPGMDLSPEARVTLPHAEALWGRMQAGAKLARWKAQGPKHSDDVVAIDGNGNIAAITHSINTVFWGKTAIFVDGISIADAASFQQAQIARVEPGSRLPSPTETGILFRDGEPVLGFASMGSGLHHKTFQALLNVTQFGMNVADAINTPDFYFPNYDTATGEITAQFPKGRFPEEVLAGLSYPYVEVAPEDARLSGEGLWVAISRDPTTGNLEAASHNRGNADAVAY